MTALESRLSGRGPLLLSGMWDLPRPGIKHLSSALAGDSLPLCHQGNPEMSSHYVMVDSRAFGEGNGKPLQYSCLENPMDGGAWWAAVHGVTTSQSRLSGFTFTFHFHAMEKEMATHSSVLAFRIPGTAEPVGLRSMGSHRVGHD